MTRRTRRSLATLACATLLASAPAPALASKQGLEQVGSQFFDLLVGRPTLFMATVAGTVYYVFSLPITAAGGQSDEAWDRFVKEPADKLVMPLGG